MLDCARARRGYFLSKLSGHKHKHKCTTRTHAHTQFCVFLLLETRKSRSPHRPTGILGDVMVAVAATAATTTAAAATATVAAADRMIPI